MSRSRSGSNGVTVSTPRPWFAFGFVLLVGLGSTSVLPKWVSNASYVATPVMLATSVAALGMCTDLRALRERGIKPLALGAISTTFIALLALLGVRLIG